MRIKVIYRRNLKMSEGKVAAQVAHAVKNLGPTAQDCSIIVLKVSDKKFEELLAEHEDAYVQVDTGRTEVEPNTPTAAAWVEDGEFVVDEEYDVVDCQHFYYDLDTNGLGGNDDMCRMGFNTDTCFHCIYNKALLAKPQ